MELKTEGTYNCIVLLGPTAVGKTSLGVRIANLYGMEIISADSRQVYRGLDIGSGKDIAEYTVDGKTIPYHMIDIADLSEEYNVFHYQQDFYRVFTELQERKAFPVIVGGTGMYLDSIVRAYDLVDVPENSDLRQELESKSLEELDTILLNLKPNLHNKSDLTIRHRVVRAIEIETYMQNPASQEKLQTMIARPDVRPFIIGTTLPRPVLRENIHKRLIERINSGMITEVSKLHENGVSWDRLERLGLEYRFISWYLEGKYESEQIMIEKLYQAIGQFAKRQETWFRGMERKGVKINWLPSVPDQNKKYKAALEMIQMQFIH